MEVLCHDTLSGGEEWLVLPPDATWGQLLRAACALFARDAASSVAVVLDCSDGAAAAAAAAAGDSDAGDDTPLSATALCGGGRVELRPSVAAVAAQLTYGRVTLDACAPWARECRETVLAAVRSFGGALRHAAPHLRADRGVVEAAVRRTPWALEFASAELRAAPEVAVLAAGRALCSASAALRSDKAFMLAAAGRDGFSLKHASAELQADAEVVLAALRVGARGGPPDEAVLKYCSTGLLGDVVFMAEACKVTARARAYAVAL